MADYHLKRGSEKIKRSIRLYELWKKNENSTILSEAGNANMDSCYHFDRYCHFSDLYREH